MPQIAFIFSVRENLIAIFLPENLKLKKKNLGFSDIRDGYNLIVLIVFMPFVQGFKLPRYFISLMSYKYWSQGYGTDLFNLFQNDWTPLHFASKAGHLETVEALVETGANALLETKDKKQPICYAAANSHFEVLIFLLKKPHNCHKLIEDARVSS